MATAGISAPAEQTILISDKWLDDNQKSLGVSCDVMTLTPPEAFETINIPKMGHNNRNEPRGVSINATYVSGKADSTQSYAVMKRRLKNDPEPVKVKYATGVIHADRVQKIYPAGTNARGIVIRA